MSARNGDKARFGAQRKKKINRRLRTDALRKEIAAAKLAAGTTAPATAA